MATCSSVSTFSAFISSARVTRPSPLAWTRLNRLRAEPATSTGSYTGATRPVPWPCAAHDGLFASADATPAKSTDQHEASPSGRLRRAHQRGARGPRRNLRRARLATIMTWPGSLSSGTPRRRRPPSQTQHDECRHPKAWQPAHCLLLQLFCYSSRAAYCLLLIASCLLLTAYSLGHRPNLPGKVKSAVGMVVETPCGS